MAVQLILGVIMAYAGFYGHSPYSGALFVEGMILANHAILLWGKKRSLNRL